MKNTPHVATRASYHQQLNQLHLSRHLLIVLSLLLACVGAWIIASLFAVKDTDDIAKQAQAATAVQINPNLDVSVFETLQQKRQFSPEELTDFPINQLIKDKAGNFYVVPIDISTAELDAITGNTSRRSTSPTTTTPATTPTTGGQPTTNTALETSSPQGATQDNTRTEDTSPATQ